MLLDDLLHVSDQQVTGAAAVSTNSVDLGKNTPSPQIGTGTPMSFLVHVKVAPTGVSIVIEVISATNPTLSAGIRVHATRTVLAADAPVGAILDVGVPQGSPLVQRYLGLRYTVAAGTATVSAFLQPAEMISIPPIAYPKAFSY